MGKVSSMEPLNRETIHSVRGTVRKASGKGPNSNDQKLPPDDGENRRLKKLGRSVRVQGFSDSWKGANSKDQKSPPEDGEAREADEIVTPGAGGTMWP